MTNANMRLVTLRVQLSESQKPELLQQKLEDGEFIVKRVVELAKLYDILRGKQVHLAHQDFRPY